MEIVRGVGISAAVLVAVILGYHIYDWKQNTLEGRLLAGTLYTALTHQIREQKLEATLAETGEILSNVVYVSSDNKERLKSHRGKKGNIPSNGTWISIEDQETLHILKTLAKSTKALRNAEEALRKASNAYNAASTTARNVRMSTAAKGGPITREIQQAEENAERAVTEATRAYITASEAKNTASTLLRRAQNNEHQVHRRPDFATSTTPKKNEEVYNLEEVILRKNSQKPKRI
jgi:hypothetical protein